ncbi:MAG: hypothetical protein ACP5RJ_09285 [Conexivisphaera sp.]
MDQGEGSGSLMIPHLHLAPTLAHVAPHLALDVIGELRIVQRILVPHQQVVPVGLPRHDHQVITVHDAQAGQRVRRDLH